MGSAIASALTERGASLCLTGRDRNKLEAVASQLLSGPQPVHSQPMDLAKDDEIRELAQFVGDQFGPTRCSNTLCRRYRARELETTSVTSLDRQYLANVHGPLLLTQVLLPLLKKPRGQIVFINSSVGLTGRANTGHFSATQHAFKAIADTLREEVNSEGIRVLSVFPGRTATPRIEALYASEGRPYQPELLLQPEDIASVVVNALSLPWTAEVTNISIRPMQRSY